jgi:hypothetical protein
MQARDGAIEESGHCRYVTNGDVLLYKENVARLTGEVNPDCISSDLVEKGATLPL